MTFKNRYTQILFILSINFTIMMAIRFSLLILYPDDFNDLSTVELIQSLFMGFRVDMITIFTFLSLIILMLTLPLKQTDSLSFRVWSGRLYTSIFALVALLSFSDVLYYDFIHRHISNELFLLANDTNIIIDMALHSYLFYTIGAILALIIYFYFMNKLFSATLANNKRTPLHWVGTFLIIVILFLGIRNSLAGKSFGMADAFAVNKVSSGNVAINGFFSIYRTAGSHKKHKKLMHTDEAIERSQQLLSTINAPFVNSNYPLLRAYHNRKKTNYNVVIVLLESWGAEHIDGFTHYPELNVTPFFKELSTKSLKFTNFYANGYRSIFGITSIYTGITLPLGTPYLGKGLELSKLSYLGQIAKQNGYSTLAMQGSNRRSYRVDAVSALAGFDNYYGAEDMPNVESVDEGRAPSTGTYDHNLFSFYHQKLNEMKEPFIGFAFTSTNHSDFHIPSKKFERYPHDLRNYNGALNAYIYVDNAIERFINGVKEEPWFDNTIFVFTSDHGSGDALNPIGRKLRGSDTKSLDSIEHFRIPLLIYAPKIFEPQTLTTLGSQADIMPTLIDILGFETPFTSMSNSLFDTTVKNRFVYFFAGNLIGYISDKGYIKYNFKDIVERKGSAQDVYNMKNNLFGVDSAESALLRQNRWAK